MKSLFKTVVPLACLVLGACAPKAESDSTSAKVDKIIKGAQADVQKMIVLTSPGGQPGSVALSGAFSFGGIFDPRVSLEAIVGVGRSGQRDALRASAIALHDHVSAASSVDALAADTTFMSIGCNNVAPAGLTKVDADFSKSVAMLSANTIYICGQQRFASSMVFMNASRIVLQNVSIVRTGSVENMFTATAGTLTLEGQNQLVTVGTSAYIDGPSLTLSAAQIEGAGTFAITARGFDNQGK